VTVGTGHGDLPDKPSGINAHLAATTQGSWKML
jgi:hypothetical protein